MAYDPGIRCVVNAPPVPVGAHWAFELLNELPRLNITKADSGYIDAVTRANPDSLGEVMFQSPEMPALTVGQAPSPPLTTMCSSIPHFQAPVLLYQMHISRSAETLFQELVPFRLMRS